MAQLHLVGKTLSAEAKKSSGDIADAFGRSAFNRYYYAAYLATRDLLITFNPKWDVSHSDAPKLVESALPALVRKEGKRLLKINALTHANEQRISSGVASAYASSQPILRTRPDLSKIVCTLLLRGHDAQRHSNTPLRGQPYPQNLYAAIQG